MKTKLFFLAVVAAFILGGALPMMLSTPTSAQSGASAIIINTQGTLSGAGQYTQSSGTFFRLVEGTPMPTPTPTPVPCEPTPGSPGSTVYFGTYTLSNNENGNFVLSVQNGNNAATGSAAPNSIPNNPRIVEQGPVTITLQINTVANPVTGNGTISFTSNGSAITGDIVITSKFVIPPSDPITCGTPTPTPTPTLTPTPTPTPTPTTAQVSGRILTPDNRGLKNASVALTDLIGNRVQAISNSFGAYKFNNVQTGTGYQVSATSKRFRFSPRFIFVDGNQTNVDLVGIE